MKVEQLTIRLEPPERRQVEAAARKLGVRVTTYSREALLERTRDVLLLGAYLEAASEEPFPHVGNGSEELANDRRQA